MLKIGIDLVNISRFQKVLSRTPASINVLFAEEELLQFGSKGPVRRYESLAGFFAVKEAFVKAYGSKIAWHHVRILKNNHGKPVIKVLNKLTHKVRLCECSIAHEGDYAIAVALLDV